MIRIILLCVCRFLVILLTSVALTISIFLSENVILLKVDVFNDFFFQNFFLAVDLGLLFDL